MNYELKNTHNWSYFHIPDIEEKGLLHGFFTRMSPDLTSLNGDKEKFLKAFSLKDCIVLNQEHSDTVHVIKEDEKPKKGDGLIIIKKHIGGIIKTADCLPIIIYDPDYPAASIIHAGWRGTVKKITERAIYKMKDLGCSISSMVAIIGPSINECCYEVGRDLYLIFKENGFTENIFNKKNDNIFLSLRKANIEILERNGITGIYDLNICTFCTPHLFYSYRKGHRNKRQINFVSLK